MVNITGLHAGGAGPRPPPDAATVRVASERSQVMLLRTRVAAFIASTLIPFTVVFYLWKFHPDRVEGGVIATLAAEAAIGLLVLGLQRGWFERRAHLAMFLLMGVICNFAQGSLLQLSGGGARSDVFFPYFLIFFGMATIFPADARWTLVTSLALVAGYPLGEWLGGHALLTRPVLVNTIRLVDYAFITVIGNRVVTGLFLRERRGQIELERANQRLREHDRIKSDFFANISHELRTPLTLILAPLESLLAAPGSDPARARALHETMHRNAVRLLALINDLLLLARLDAGRLEQPRREPVDVAEVCRQAVEATRPLAAQLGLTVGLDEAARPWWRGDREHLERVLLNLLSNACKFSRPGGRVAVALATDGDGHFTIAVRDEGVGVAPEDLERIFDRFVQAESHAARRWPGTGIGLSIVKELVELHGGRVAVASRPGEGATFRVRLARSTEALPGSARSPVPAPLPPPLPLPPEDRPSLAAPAGRPRLVVVEDNAELLDYLARELAPEFAVTPATDGHRGLALALATRPSLVLADVMMPDLDGLELVRRLRADPRGRDVPIILLSARGDLATKLSGFAEGADDYLSKPFALPELRARIRLQLRIRAAESRVVLSEKLATLGMVVAGVAHEVNNPLHFVRGNVELLRRLLASSDATVGDTTRAAAAPLFGDLEVGLERLGNVTRQLVRLARHEPGPVEDVDLAQLVDLVVRVLAPRIGAGVRVVPQLEVRALRGASQELFQVLVNLVENALHAVGTAGRVTVASDRLGGGAVTLTVRDDGPGIPPEIADRIFEPFFTTRPAGQGSGLGLAIVQQLVERRGGTVRVDTRPGAGSAFVVTLPQPAGVNEPAR